LFKLFFVPEIAEIAEMAESPTSPNIGCARSRARLLSLARPALSRARLLAPVARAPARACARGVCLVLSGPVLRALLRCLERIAAGSHMDTNQSGAMKTLLVVTAAFGAHKRHPFGPIPTACPLHN